MGAVLNLVFLDRDGVINQLIERDGGRFSPLRFEDFFLLEGVELAIKQLVESCFRIVVVTNQPDISRGRLLMSELHKMHDRLLELAIEEVLYCPHESSNFCDCRKPNTGLLSNFLNRIPQHPQNIWMVGDRNSDLLAGRRVGARSIWISTGQQEFAPPAELFDHVAPSLAVAANIIQEEVSLLVKD